MKKDRHELMLAVWPNKTGGEYFGDGGTSSLDSCGSATLQFRMVNTTDPDSWGTEDNRAVSDIQAMVWYGDDGCISIDLRMRTWGSLTMREMGLRLKKMKLLASKAERNGFRLSGFVRDSDMHDELTRFVAAIGITQSINYGSGRKDDFSQVDVAVNRIATTLQGRMDELARRKKVAA